MLQGREVLPPEQRYEVGEDEVRSQDERDPEHEQTCPGLADEECEQHEGFTSKKALAINVANGIQRPLIVSAHLGEDLERGQH